MNLLVWSLQSSIGELARAKGIKGFRVDHKVNARGEVVIALILPPSPTGLTPEPGEERRAKHLR